MTSTIHVLLHSLLSLEPGLDAGHQPYLYGAYLIVWLAIIAYFIKLLLDERRLRQKIGRGAGSS